MANIALLGRLVTGVEHDNDHSAATDEAQPITRAVVNPHLGNFTFDRLPVSEASSFCLPQARWDAKLSAFVLERIKLRNKLFGLADCEHATHVANWIQRVKSESAFPKSGMGLKLDSGDVNRRVG